MSGSGASASICQAILPTRTRTPVPRKGLQAMAQGLVMELGGRRLLWHARNPEFDLLRYKHIHKGNDTTSTCTTTVGILESKATLQEGNRALKTAGSEARARIIQMESQRFCTRMEKKSLRNDRNMYKERDSLKDKSGTESYRNNDRNRLKPN